MTGCGLYRFGDNDGGDDGVGSGESEHGQGCDLDRNHSEDF